MANFFFTKKKEKMTRGILTEKTMMYCGIENASSRRIAIPLMPPIVNSLGKIKLYAAKDTRKEESNKNSTVCVQ